MCVVDVDLYVVRKFLQTFFTKLCLVLPYDLAETCRDKEVFLSQSQLLSDT